jgi:hypothetical protein
VKDGWFTFGLLIGFIAGLLSGVCIERFVTYLLSL